MEFVLPLGLPRSVVCHIARLDWWAFDQRMNKTPRAADIVLTAWGFRLGQLSANRINMENVLRCEYTSFDGLKPLGRYLSDAMARPGPQHEVTPPMVVNMPSPARQLDINQQITRIPLCDPCDRH